MFKEIFRSVLMHSILHKERKKKQTKYNTADQVVNMEAVNVMLMRCNKIFFLLNYNRQKILCSITLSKVNESFSFSSNN